MLEVRNLSLSYGGEKILWDINFNVPRGELMAIVGPNGAGKSSLIKAILNLVPILSGEILIEGKETKGKAKGGIKEKIKVGKIAYIPQRSLIDWDFPINAFDVVLMGRYRFLKRLNKQDHECALEALEKVGMSEFKNRQINNLSGGQQQRVFLARALAQNADIYLLDEPFSGIDAKSEASIVDIFKSLRRDHKTLLVVHHDLSNISEYFSSVLLLNKTLIAYGPVKSVYTAANISLTYQEASPKSISKEIHEGKLQQGEVQAEIKKKIKEGA